MFCSANKLHRIICEQSRRRPRFTDCLFIGNILFLLYFGFLNASAAEAPFLGRDSCSSSGCHGGAGAQQNQSLVWSRQDPHSRAAATLTSARSKRIAQVAQISDPASDRRCTSCHSPWQGLVAELFPASLNASIESISCEVCHGPARDYIRSHTRPDLTRAQKGIDGLRDLTIIYNRANACVACHQILDPALLAAGHPELIFELDGQSSAMPRHWTEPDPQHRLKSWLTGQAAALRESTAQMIQHHKSNSVSTNSFQQFQSLLWIVSRALPDHKTASFFNNSLSSPPSLTVLSNLHRTADALALQTSIQTPAEPIILLQRLSRTADDFKTDQLIPAVHRAERLVLAFDRLSHAAGTQTVASVNQSLQDLFALVQSRPDFKPAKFAAAVETLRKQLPSQ
jgi:hypothetical protein